MLLTKYQHSCILLEDQGKTILIDPGNYSTELLQPESLSALDYLLITHEHMDHMDIPTIKTLAAKFPKLKIITNNSVKNILEKEGIAASVQSDEIVQIEPVPHEKIWMGQPAENIEVTVFDKLSHPGDSLSFDKTAEILCLPISGPWCNTTQAVELGEKVKPKIIIPIHDFHWKDDVRIGMYQRLHDYFEQRGIDFKVLENGKTIEV